MSEKSPKKKRKESTSSDSSDEEDNDSKKLEKQNEKPLIFARSKEIFRYTSQIINPKEHEWWYLWRKDKKKGSKSKDDDDEESDDEAKKSKGEEESKKDGRRSSSLPNLNENENKDDVNHLYVIENPPAAITNSVKKSILSKKNAPKQTKN